MILIKEEKLPESTESTTCAEPIGYSKETSTNLYVICSNYDEDFSQFLKIDVTKDGKIAFKNDKKFPKFQTDDTFGFVSAITESEKLVVFGRNSPTEYLMLVMDTNLMTIKKREQIPGDVSINFLVDDYDNVLFCSNYVYYDVYIRCFVKSLL